YFIKCEKAIKDESTGEIVELICTYDPATKGGNAPDGRKVKGTIHWVSVEHAKKAQVNLYDRLFVDENPSAVKGQGSIFDSINPGSLEVLDNCYVEPSLIGAEVFSKFQFERLGYFCVDPQSNQEKLVFNRTVTLRDSWAKIAKK
ncbi:MAG: glutamine--tRNA ligase, partial [Candidatus Omnitrophica bacterium]|nr:glutamine--tRNA ligase [Candidatus Omnitrophota bacterium]